MDNALRHQQIVRVDGEYWIATSTSFAPGAFGSGTAAETVVDCRIPKDGCSHLTLSIGARPHSCGPDARSVWSPARPKQKADPFAGTPVKANRPDLSNGLSRDALS